MSDIDTVFHIVTLAWLALVSATWSSRGYLNIAIKLAATLSAAAAAVIVARDLFQ